MTPPGLPLAPCSTRSGHYDMFKDDMFWMEGSDEGEEVGLKPTNCPGPLRICST